MEILIRNSQKITAKIRRLKSLAQRLLQAEGCGENTEVSILLTDDKQIKILNRDYRDIDSPTDVLSFSQAEGDESFDDGPDDGLLGDVVISVETARRQAREQKNSLEEELDMLLVHGILHLLGYDHEKPEDEKRMFSKQEELLKG